MPIAIALVTIYYFVSAANAGGESANSTQVSAAPIALPSVPTGLAATATNGSTALSWTASTGSGTINYKKCEKSVDSKLERQSTISSDVSDYPFSNIDNLKVNY